MNSGLCISGSGLLDPAFCISQLSTSSFLEWLNQPVLPPSVHESGPMDPPFHRVCGSSSSSPWYSHVCLHVKKHYTFYAKEGKCCLGLCTQFILRFHLSQLEEFNQADLLELLHSGSRPSRISSNCSIFMHSFPPLPGIAPESYWLNVKRIRCWPSIRFAKIAFIWTILFWLRSSICHLDKLLNPFKEMDHILP